MNRPILIYINVSIMGCVNEVLKELIDSIKESGIIEYCHSINFIVNGDKDLLIIEDISKSNIIYTERDTSVCEFMSLDKIWKDSKDAVNNNNDLTILYLHTKGVSRTSDNIKDWTRLLTYFNVTKWKDRIKEIDSYDCTGINLSGSLDDLYSHPSDWGYTKTPVCYAGNFWWSKASHIVRLNNPIEWAPDEDLLRWKMMNEMWICSYPTGKYNNAYHSKVDHYWNPYPIHLYSDEHRNIKGELSYKKENEKMSNTIINYDPIKRDHNVRTINVNSAWGDIPTILSDIIERFSINNEKAIEFGVELGYSTSAISNYFNNVVGVDTFLGDTHSGYKNDTYEITKSNLIDYPNIKLVQASYQDYTANDSDEHYGLAHVDIIHTYEDTYKCGEWCMDHADVVIFHDTISFPDVMKACLELADKYNADFYNYLPSCGLGILVKKK